MANEGADADPRGIPHPWRAALALVVLTLALEAAAAFAAPAENVLFAPERLLGLPARFEERPSTLAGPFPPSLDTPAGSVLYPTLVPVFAAFAFAQMTRHARLAYWVAFALFAAFPFVWIASGAASWHPRILAEALGWAAAIGAIAGLVAGPRRRGTMSREEAAPVLGLLGLGAIALWPVAARAPHLLHWALAAYALGGAVVAYAAGTRWRERAVAAAAGSGAALGLALAAEITGAAEAAWGASGSAALVLALTPIWTVSAVLGAEFGRRRATAVQASA